MDINARIARRVCELRDAQGFSLDALAERSGVSRSNISLIERGQSSPTSRTAPTSPRCSCVARPAAAASRSG